MLDIQRVRLWSSECTTEIKMWNQRFFQKRSKSYIASCWKSSFSESNQVPVMSGDICRGDSPTGISFEWWLPCLDSKLQSRNQRVCYITAGATTLLLIYCCKSKQTKSKTRTHTHTHFFPRVHVKICILSLSCMSFYVTCNYKSYKAECRCYYFLCVWN